MLSTVTSTPQMGDLSPCVAPQWAVPPDLLTANTRIVADNPDTHDTSLTTILNRQVSQLWMPKEHREAIAFLGESGEFFQLRYTFNPPVHDGKPQRYDAVQHSGCKYLLPNIPADYRRLIATRWGVNLPLEGSVWEWIRDAKDCPIFDAEGAAKALTLISLGYPAISGYGAFGGIETNEYRTFKRPIGKRKSGKSGGYTVEKVPIAARLPETLSTLAAVPRRFVIVPDMDVSPKTRRRVANAVLRRARLLEKRGCRVEICYWDSGLGKGIDDVLNHHGAVVVQQILDHPLTPEQYELKIVLSFGLAKPDVTVNSRDMQVDAPDLPKTGIVITDAGLGTGKTKLAARETQGRTLLAPYPLRSLAQSAAYRLLADYRNDGTLNRGQGAYYSDGEVLSDRLTIVYDSLKNLDLTNQFAGELDDLLLDEITHGLRHMLTGATCKQDRLAILETFMKAVRVSKRVLAFDADLTPTELDLLRELRPEDAVFYLQNIRKPDPWSVQWLNLTGKSRTVAAAIESISSQLPTEGLIHWACDSRKTSELIAAYLDSLGLKCAVINSNSRQVKDPLAELAIAGQFDPLEMLGVRVIITSPSVIQGLSWEEPNRFSLVVGTFTGCTITPRQMRQALARVRQAVPRMVWAAEYRKVPGKWGNERNPEKIKARILELSTWNQLQLQGEIQALSETRRVALDWAARLMANDNVWSARPADGLRVLLEQQGHQIQPLVIGANGAAYQVTAQEWQHNQKMAVLNAEVIGHVQALTLKTKVEFERLTPEEHRMLERYELCQFYAIHPDELTLEWIELDQDGSFRKVVKAFEHLYAPDGLELATKQACEALGLADVDQDRGLAAVKLRDVLGIQELVELFRGGRIHQDHERLTAFVHQCWDARKLIKVALNYTVRETVAPMQIAVALLQQLGLKLNVSRTRNEQGKPIRVYSLDMELWDLLTALTKRRYCQRLDGTPSSDPTMTSDPLEEDGSISQNREDSNEKANSAEGVLSETLRQPQKEQAISEVEVETRLDLLDPTLKSRCRAAKASLPLGIVIGRSLS